MIAIVLATYNGEKYISAQIDSIIHQSYPYWNLYIRDDCSTDNTLPILKSYLKKDNRIKIIPNNNNRLGITGNFNAILSQISDEEYIMCSDQDDVWLEDKIEKSLGRLKELENQFPGQSNLVFSNSILTDSELNPLGKNLYPKNLKLGLNHFLFMNAGYQGAAMIFNKSLLSLFHPLPNSLRVHDFYISLSAYLNGHIDFISEPLAYYRRHMNASNHEYITILDRIKGLLSGRPLIYNPDMYIAIQNYIKNNLIKEKDYKIITEYFSLISGHKPFFKKITTIFRNNFTLRGSKSYLLLKLTILKTK